MHGHAWRLWCQMADASRCNTFVCVQRLDSIKKRREKYNNCIARHIIFWDQPSTVVATLISFSRPRLISLQSACNCIHAVLNYAGTTRCCSVDGVLLSERRERALSAWPGSQCQAFAFGCRVTCSTCSNTKSRHLLRTVNAFSL